MAHLLMIEGWISESGNLILPLLKKLGYTYTFATRNPELYKTLNPKEIHPLFKDAKNILQVDTNNISELIEVVKKYQFDGVISVCDYYFEAVQSVANALKIPCAVPHNLKNIRQKHLMRQTLDNAGLPNAKFKLANSWEETLQGARQIGYPLIIKPVDLAASAYVCLIHNELELKEAFNKLDQFKVNFRGQIRNKVILLEEFMVGEEVSVESVSFQGETTIIGVTDKSLTGTPYFIETGHMFPAKIGDEQYSTLIEYVQKVLNAIDFDNGVAHTEVKLTKNGPRIVEINPRTPGGYIVELVEYVTGINLLKVFLDLTIGKKPILKKVITDIKSAAVMFLVPPHEGIIQNIKGTDLLDKNKNIIRYHIPECENKQIEAPVDNDCYLGHIITKDTVGQHAREYVENAIKNIKLIYK